MGNRNKRKEERKAEFIARCVQQKVEDLDKAHWRLQERVRRPPSPPSQEDVNALKALKALKEMQDARDVISQSLLHPPKSWNDDISAHFRENKSKVLKNAPGSSLLKPVELRSFPKEKIPPKFEVISKPKRGALQSLMDTYPQDDENLIGDQEEQPKEIWQNPKGEGDWSVQYSDVAVDKNLETIAQDLCQKGSWEDAAIVHLKLAQDHQRSKRQFEAGFAFVRAARCSKKQKDVIKFLNLASSMFVGIDSFKLCGSCAKEIAERLVEEKSFGQAILYLERAIFFYEQAVAIAGDAILRANIIASTNQCKQRIAECTTSLNEEFLNSDDFLDEARGKKWKSLFALGKDDEA